MSGNNLAQAIKTLALEMGFVAVGITRPDPPAHLDVYTDWLKQGCHGEMEYLAEPRRVYLRSQPGELLPGCQSIIVLAARYAAPPSISHPPPRSQREYPSPPAPLPKGRSLTPYPSPSGRGEQTSSPTHLRGGEGSNPNSQPLSQGEYPSPPSPLPGGEGRVPHPQPLSQGERGEESPSPLGRGARGEGSQGNEDVFFGRVAAYAWGEDYHNILRQRMESLMQRVQEIIGRPIAYRCFTDNAPILERELAQRAGLGWIGKNTCLIHPRLGSYLFLAEIFTDLALPPDPAFVPDRCGTCQRCLQACPTQCILPNRTIDARRCISYLTIELKSAIPPELRPLLEDWVFGCDICQQVCPWNRRVAESPSFPEFQPRAEQVWLSIPEILSLTREKFKQKFHHTPLMRSKWRGLSRNAAVVLGNLSRSRPPLHPNILKFFVHALQDHPDSLVRQHLAWSLAQLNLAIARQALQEHLQKESDPMVKAEIEALLG